MAKKYPSWTPEKDHLLLCAAHVHRDVATGYVRWKEVAEVVAQGVHSPKSCCGRHTHLIKNYSEAEKALRVGSVNESSPATSPAPSPTKQRTSNTKSSSRPFTTGVSSRLGQECQARNDCGDAGSANYPQELEIQECSARSEQTSSSKNKEGKDTQSNQGKKRSSTDETDDQQEEPRAKTKKKRAKKRARESETNAQPKMATADTASTVPLTAAGTSPASHACAGLSTSCNTGSRTPYHAGSSHSSNIQPPQRQPTWSLPTHGRPYNRSWNRPNRYQNDFQRAHPPPWLDKMMKDFKVQVLDDLRRSAREA